ncbi:MAG: hypothetical protein IPJ40_06150 [Saprospirales bacterium]|nr:hypothetical protein [Saprospirales bacterium]
MSQFVSNSAERRNTILRFMALFLLTVVVACFAFLRLFYVKTEIPVQELQQFKELAPVLEKLVDYGESLHAYEQALTSNPVEAPRLQSLANEGSVEIHSMLYGKEKNPHHPQISKILVMGDQFFSYLNQSGDKFLTSQKDLDECKGDKKDLEKDMDDLKDDLKKCEEEKAKCKKW